MEMLSRNRKSRVRQHYINAVAIVEGKEVRLIKKFRDGMRRFEELEQKKFEKKAQLKESSKIKEAHEEAIEKLKEFKGSQEIEMIRLRQQMKAHTKRHVAQSICLDSDVLTIHGTDREIAYKKQSIHSCLKVASNLYVSETSSPDLIRGFVCNEFEDSVIPYEIDLNKCSKSDATEQMWELVKKSSPYSENWEDIFLSGENF